MTIEAGHRWTVGEKVLVEGDRGHLRRQKVARVLKRFIEMEDKSQWTHDGHRYPRSGWMFNGGFLHLPTPELLAIAQRQRVLNRIKKTEWETLSTGFLENMLKTIYTEIQS